MTKDTNEGVTGKTVPGRPWRELYDKKERAFREKKSQDYAKSKGFNVKRDKSGGFSFSMHKKIKGFEEGADMGNEPVNELSQYKLKRYVKAASTDIGKRAYSAGLKGGADKPEAKQDVQRAEKHAKYIPKAVHRIQGKYYPKYVRERNPNYGGSRKYEKSAHGEGLYKPKVPGGKYPAGVKSGEERERFPRKMGRLGKYRANEDIEMSKEQIDETSLKKAIDYRDAASIDYSDRDAQAGAGTNVKKNVEVMRKRFRGLELAGRKIKKLTKGVKEEIGDSSDPSSQNPWQWKKKKEKEREPAHRAETGIPKTDPKKVGSAWKKSIGKGRPPLREDEEENQEPATELSDLVVHAIDQRPLEFQQSFADLMQQRIEDAVHDKKLEIAAGFAGANTEPIDVDFEDEDGPVEDDDWDGTEYEGDDTPGEPEQE